MRCDSGGGRLRKVFQRNISNGKGCQTAAFLLVLGRRYPQFLLESLVKMGVIIEGQRIGDFCYRIFFQEQLTAFLDLGIQY